MTLSFTNARELLHRAIVERAFPSAVVEVGTETRPLWQEAFGALTYDAAAPPATLDTIYDLASLTKVLSTTPLAMRALENGALALADPVASHVTRWAGADRAAVTIHDLLAHCSGLPGHRHFYRDRSGRDAFEEAICREPLEYAPGTRSIYSDLGFMLLGFVLEDAQHRSDSFTGAPGARDPGRRLDAQFRRLATFLTPEPLGFSPPRSWRDRTAPTEVDPWRGRLLVGEVHDENTWALGGVAGHAGLFGTVAAVGAFARAVLATLDGQPVLARTDTMRRFIQPSGVPGSSRALGWDTMLPTSSCGTRLSPTAIGHTGFTGTSLWIDWERDLYIVLLTNRVHPTRENDAIRRVRPQVHDAVVEAFDRSFR